MGRFADARLAAMTDGEMDQFEGLLEAPDQDLLAWITGERAVPANYDMPIFQALRAFHLGSKYQP
jgi:antitoxin CptB